SNAAGTFYRSEVFRCAVDDAQDATGKQLRRANSEKGKSNLFYQDLGQIMDTFDCIATKLDVKEYDPSGKLQPMLSSRSCKPQD
ncbi:MAG: hypothetical protein ACRDF4_10365, partial [Rhabdochlamydiaceae bacterium]